MIVSDLTVPTSEQLAALEELLARVRAADGIQAVVSTQVFEPGPRQGTMHAVYEDERMIGALVIMRFAEPEALVFVDPDRRRQGIGRALVSALCGEMHAKKEPEGLLVAELAARAAEPFLAAIGAPFVEAEYQMEIGKRPELETDEVVGLMMRHATMDDRDLLIALHVAVFGGSVGASSEHIDAGLAETHRHFVIAEIDGEAVGFVRRGEWDGVGDITSLGVVPEQRGRGIGRGLLLDATQWLFDQGYSRVVLEVATENPNALMLYQSTGYRITSQYGYFRILAG